MMKKIVQFAYRENEYVTWVKGTFFVAWLMKSAQLIMNLSTQGLKGLESLVLVTRIPHKDSKHIKGSVLWISIKNNFYKIPYMSFFIV